MTATEIMEMAEKVTRNIRNEHDREDAMQQYALGAWEATCKADADRNVSGYQHISGMGEVRHFQKKRLYYWAHEKSDLPIYNSEGEPNMLTELLSSDCAPADVVVEEAEKVQTLYDKIDALPERERAVIRALHVDGLTLEQTGNRLGITKQRVAQIEDKAFETLRVWLRN